MNPRLLVLAAALLAGLTTGCAAGPELRTSHPATFTAPDLQLSARGLTDFSARLEGSVESPLVPAVVERARWELVVDGKVVASGEQPLGVAIPAGGRGSFSLEKGARLVESPDALAALQERSSTVLTALRGELVLERGGREERLPFARSHELRVPRLPAVLLQELSGARYSADRVVMTLYLAVRNPNPFPVRLGNLHWQAAFGGKPLSEGSVGRGAEVAASSLAVYELQVEVDRDSFGPEVVPLIATQRIPYRITGALAGELFEVPYSLEGEVRLTGSR